MALEELLPENIDCIYAAKLMAPYLEIASPLLPKPSKADMAKQAVYGALWKCLQGAGSVYCVLEDSLYVLTHPKYWKQEREERKQLRKEREERKRMGLKSRDEEMAQSLIDAHDADEKELEQKLTEAGALMPQGRGAFDVAHCAGVFLSSSIFHADKDGYEITERLRSFPIEIKVPYDRFKDMIGDIIRGGTGCLEYDSGYIINPDFTDKVKVCLLQEINSRLENGKQFNLLDKVIVRMDEIQSVYLRSL